MSHVYENTEYKSPAVWRVVTDGVIPEDAVRGGTDQNGEPLYVGRACRDGDCIPGKIVASLKTCYIPYHGGEHEHREYQVLTNPNGAHLEWVPASEGQLPNGAVQGGQESDGERLYIGRAQHDVAIVIGKVHPRHGVLYLPYSGKEVKVTNYDVLVVRELAH